MNDTDNIKVEDYTKEVAAASLGDSPVKSSVSQQLSQKSISREIGALFDWEHEFYNWIKDRPEYADNLRILKDALAMDHWRKRFIKRASGFFFFVQQLCDYIQKAVFIREGIPYYDIPGYEKIVKTFIIEMKDKDIKAYPDSMIDASVSILNNVRLLSPFCGIVLQKTR